MRIIIAKFAFYLRDFIMRNYLRVDIIMKKFHVRKTLYLDIYF